MSRGELAQLVAAPPLEYSDFMTYFWESGQLSKEQLGWQLEQVKEKGVGRYLVLPALGARRALRAVSSLLEQIARVEFCVVLLSLMTTIRTDTLAKLKAFYEGGDTVVAFRSLPGGSAEQGREDPRIRALLQDIFGVASSAEYVHTLEKAARRPAVYRCIKRS